MRDFIKILHRQKRFSIRAFGPGQRAAGCIDHIRKELAEVEKAPTDLEEWIDIAMLAMDGAWRAGYTAEQVAAAYVAKLEKNEGRDWPDWRTADPNKAIEHVREEEKPCEPLKFIYRNWRGTTAVRTAVPLKVWYGSTVWHPEPQWFLKAIDSDKAVERDFALADMTGIGTASLSAPAGDWFWPIGEAEAAERTHENAVQSYFDLNDYDEPIAIELERSLELPSIFAAVTRKEGAEDLTITLHHTYAEAEAALGGGNG